MGLDAHKRGISLSVAEPGRLPRRVIRKFRHDAHRRIEALANMALAKQLHLVYEAAARGYGLQRALQAKGYTGEIAAKS